MHQQCTNLYLKNGKVEYAFAQCKSGPPSSRFDDFKEVLNLEFSIVCIVVDCADWVFLCSGRAELCRTIFHAEKVTYSK